MKGGERWRFTTTAKMHNYTPSLENTAGIASMEQPQNSEIKLKKGRSTAIKLSEIKEVNQED